MNPPASDLRLHGVRVVGFHEHLVEVNGVPQGIEMAPTLVDDADAALVTRDSAERVVTYLLDEIDRLRPYVEDQPVTTMPLDVPILVRWRDGWLSLGVHKHYGVCREIRINGVSHAFSKFTGWRRA